MKKYNYVYKTTNNINGKYYIGVHKTNKLEDGYLGSGKILNRAIEKYGKENFTKEIICFCETYAECLDIESELVNEEFLLNENVYNLIKGGAGRRVDYVHPEEIRKHLSKISKENWEKNKDRIMQQRYESDHYEKSGKGVSEYIKNNQDEFQEKMLKINTNPDKISKTAETHRGMKRSDEACQNISNAKKENNKKRKDAGETCICGAGMKYVYNSLTEKMKRVDVDYILQNYEQWGNGGSKNKGSVYVTNLITKQTKRMPKDYQLQDNEVFGRKFYAR